MIIFFTGYYLIFSKYFRIITSNLIFEFSKTYQKIIIKVKWVSVDQMYWYVGLVVGESDDRDLHSPQPIN